MKICSKCRELKPEDTGFYRQGSGYHASCKECVKARAKAWKKANPERAREAQRRSDARQRELYPERCKETQKRSYLKHREARLAQKKQRREETKEERAAAWQRWYHRNRDKILKELRENYDPEKKRASRSPGQIRRARDKRRALMLDAFVAHVDFDEVLIRDSGMCGICGEAVMEETIELDHIVPLAAGGTHEPNNVQPAHRSCNRRKWAHVEPEAIAA